MPAVLHVADRINTSDPRVAAAVARRDPEYVADLARRQMLAGADALDVNVWAADPAECRAGMTWLAGVVAAEVASLRASMPSRQAARPEIWLDCVDAPSVAAGIEAVRATDAMLPVVVNSAAPVRGRWAEMIELAATTGAGLVVQAFDGTGPPRGAEERLRRVESLLRDDVLRDAMRRSRGIDGRARLWIDPCLLNVSAEPDSPVQVARCVRESKPLRVGWRRETGVPVAVVAAVRNHGWGRPRGERRRIEAGAERLLRDAGIGALMLDVLAGRDG